MDTPYEIKYDTLVVQKDLKDLDRSMLLRIRAAIETKLITQPDVYGKPLRGVLRGIWSLRVGEYRVAYRIVRHTVYIDVIEHRSVIYAIAVSRYRTRYS